MKKLLSLLISSIMLLSVCPTPIAADENVPTDLKILCIGNSFSVDTIEYVASIAKSLGVKNVKLGNLYIGGCSIKKHYYNATNNVKQYEYFQNSGSGWKSTKGHDILTTLKSEDWDVISIQHGTNDGSRYAEESSYNDLPALVKLIRDNVDEKTKIAFNMTWVGEKNSHAEMIAFGNDQIKYYNAVANLTKTLVKNTEGIDIVSPTGTAIQNARTASVGLLTRDSYHLTMNLGRYIAGLTFFKAVTGADISKIKFAPSGLSDYMKSVAIESVNNAFSEPFSITESQLEVPEFVWPKNVTYGPAAFHETKYHEHCAKLSPVVENKVDLLALFNLGETYPLITGTAETANNLGLKVDLNKTPYLYYSFIVPKGSDFTFSIYADPTYSPWLSFLDKREGEAKLGQSAESWDAATGSGRAQYVTETQTGCIDLREYSVEGADKWMISRLKLYAPKGAGVTISYFFLGSEATETPYVEEEESIPEASTENSIPDTSLEASNEITSESSLPEKNGIGKYIIPASICAVALLSASVVILKKRKK